MILKSIRIPLLAAFACAAIFPVSSPAGDGDKKKPSAAEARKSASTTEAKKPGNNQKPSTRKRPADAKRKPAENRQLAEARESLHLAQKALADKNDAIRALEAKVKSLTDNLAKAQAGLKKTETDLKKASDEIKKFKSSDFNKLAHTLDAERKKNAQLNEILKKTRLEAAAALAKAKQSAPAPPKKPDPRSAPAADAKKPALKPQAQSQKPAVAQVTYDARSAVNYEERDRVLKDIRAVLKKTPKAGIRITGYADDTPYKETNQQIGANRAKYLADYLVIKGVPATQIQTQGVGSPRQGNGNRRAVIQIRN